MAAADGPDEPERLEVVRGRHFELSLGGAASTSLQGPTYSTGADVRLWYGRLGAAMRLEHVGTVRQAGEDFEGWQLDLGAAVPIRVTGDDDGGLMLQVAVGVTGGFFAETTAGANSGAHGAGGLFSTGDFAVHSGAFVASLGVGVRQISFGADAPIDSRSVFETRARIGVRF